MRLLRRLPKRPPAALPLALLLPVALASSPLAAQQVYKWKDAAGVTHFTAEPPPEGQPYQAREVDHHQAAPLAEDAGEKAETAPRGEDPACASARSNLALLQGKAQLTVDSDGDGKPDKPLSEGERTKQRNLAQAILAAKCGGNADQVRAPEPEER
jgi:hypothetical protein